jgi:hypothetical protein
MASRRVVSDTVLFGRMLQKCGEGRRDSGMQSPGCVMCTRNNGRHTIGSSARTPLKRIEQIHGWCITIARVREAVIQPKGTSWDGSRTSRSHARHTAFIHPLLLEDLCAAS